MFWNHIVGLLCLLIFSAFMLHGAGESEKNTSETWQDGKPLFHFGSPGFIAEWLMATDFPDTFEPYPGADHAPTLGYGIDYLASIGGEADARPEEGTVVEYDGSRFIFEKVSGRWMRQARRMNIGLSSGGNALYGCCYILSEEDTTAWLLIGSPWYCQVWVNGRLLYPWNLERSKNDPEVFPVSLREGINTLLVKHLQVDGKGNPRFQLLNAKEARRRVGRLFKPVLNISIEKPFTIQSEDSGDAGKTRGTIVVDIRQAQSLCQDLKADISVLDTEANERSNGSYIRWERLYPRHYEPEGNVLFESSENLDKSVEMTLPKGIYRICTRLEDFFRRTLLGEIGLIVDENPKRYVERVLERAEKYRKRNDLIASAGWLTHLASQVEKRLDDEDDPSGETCWWTHRLVYWLDRLEKEPLDMLNQRNWMEWAYLSKVDGSGQPFIMQIPEEYDPDKAWPLHVWLHGSGQNHLSYRQDEKFGTDPEALHLSVFARSRSGGYIGLSEVDALEAMDFVRKYWNIDPDRIHLYGYSMGGGGTYWIGSRYPHLFATLRPQAAGRIGVQLENLLHLPVYHVHSRDDSRAPYIAGAASVNRLDELGNSVVMDATSHEDHWIWNYEEGIQRARDWADRHRRVEVVRDIRYTALDEAARGAYWVAVNEWGKEGRPAIIRARLGEDNGLYCSLDNVGCLRVDLADSPADQDRPLRVYVDGKPLLVLKSPLPETIYIRSGEEGWYVVEELPEETGKRLHFPGGIMALYHGEPLMVVWGTQGDPQTVQRIARCAESARRACRPSWPQPEPWEDLPRYEMPFGMLPGKPDTAVTASEMEKYNLLLIGDANQNLLVRRMMDQLPVQIRGDRVEASDGVSWSYEDRALGLLYPNPFDSQRLIYWIASSYSDFYTYESSFFEEQARMTAPPDFILLDELNPRRVAARRFDSRWEWELGYADSQPLPADAISDGGASLVADAMKKHTGADFALFSHRIGVTSGTLGSEGSRRKDLLAWAYDQRLNMMTLSGDLLERCSRKVEEGNIDIQLYPNPEKISIDPTKYYRIVMIDQAVSVYVTAMGNQPDSLILLDYYLYDALERYLPLDMSLDKRN
jgi:poly(3-hydroxybutyrate) depolymerase